ncbi:diadenylate cyclase CdaA [Peptoniphilus raoultii]|uniref:diadenylate cyclase CdaA n=1 Tax=Peptoniphilus raoultii TaxID=1776387 RepID=UPI0008DAF893|nr:diadenylate cyclase CdaA [Peptoniphilus raoultii]
MHDLTHYLSFINLRDIIDIAIVAILIYFILNLIRNTRAEQVFKGIIILLAFMLISQFFQLYTINWIFSKLITGGLLALIIVFQPELRRGLEFLGRTSSIKNNFGSDQEKIPAVVIEICNAVGSLSRQKIGALIIIERKVGLTEIIETGTKINGNVSSGLLINIFIPNTPLHDGAVIIKGPVVLAAACFLPLSDSKAISKELGTRHRAGIGISERSDCLSIMVSEETGQISTASDGVISRYLDLETLEQLLLEIYRPDINDGSSILNKLKKWSEGNEK